MESGNQSSMQTDKHSVPMVTAAVVLSVIAVSTVCCIYVSFICGILGIIFALLSKGGETTMSPSARTACVVSVTAIVLSVLLLCGSFLTLIMQYGSIEQFWKAYMEILETDFR